MSTNFYVTLPSRYQDIKPLVLHIGKRSVGWVFSFQSYQPGVRRDLNSWDDWKAFLSVKPSAVIHDEYNRIHTLSELEKEIFKTLEPWGPGQVSPYKKTESRFGNTILDKYGFSHSNYEFS